MSAIDFFEDEFAGGVFAGFLVGIVITMMLVTLCLFIFSPKISLTQQQGNIICHKLTNSSTSVASMEYPEQPSSKNPIFVCQEPVQVEDEQVVIKCKGCGK